MTDTFDEALAEVVDDAGRATAEAFRARAIEVLRDAGRRVDYDVEPVIDSVTPVTRQADGTYTFSVEHEVATIFEYGSAPHTIEGEDGPLVFETADGETVFVESVEHPGTDALLYMTTAKQEVTTQGLERVD